MDGVTIERLGANPLLDNLQRLGGWPILVYLISLISDYQTKIIFKLLKEGDKWQEWPHDFIEQVRKQRHAGVPHSMFVVAEPTPDFTNTSFYIIGIRYVEICLKHRM